VIARAAAEKKAEEIKIIDVHQASAVTSYFVIVSGGSPPQLRAIAEEITAALKKKKIKGFALEGELGSGWVVLDAGPVVAHIMGIKERRYYNLEELWGKQGIVYHL
jgi:ribosome-associated protein